MVPACHNAEDSITISGPADDVRKFVTELQAKDVFAKMINSNGIAFHSYFMKDVAEDLKKVLEKVHITPLQRNRTNHYFIEPCKTLFYSENLTTKFELIVSRNIPKLAVSCES